MLYALICKDKTGHLEVRKQNREAHLAYISAQGKTRMAGPLLDTAGDMCGSLIVLDVEDRAAAEAWVAGDPYGQAGLFESVEIHGWKQVV